jgi:hypothetical protein
VRILRSAHGKNDCQLGERYGKSVGLGVRRTARGEVFYERHAPFLGRHLVSGILTILTLSKQCDWSDARIRRLSVFNVEGLEED